MTTIPALARDYAYAFDVRRIDTDAVLGVGVVVPSMQHLSFHAEGASAAVTRTLSAAVWDDISAWVTESDENLPTEPSPMSARVVAAILHGVDSSTVIARRFAAIPVDERFHDAMAAGKVLPQLFNMRG
jgi:hypothetical protein